MLESSPVAPPYRVGAGFDEFLCSLPPDCAALRRQTLDVLDVLYRHRGRVVSKRAMFDTVWAGLAVTDDSLVQCVTEIRRALARHAPVALHTHRRRGYRLTWTGDAAREGPGPTRPPTVAVLAFAHTGRPGEAGLAHGLVEDIIGELARRRRCLVVAGRSGARYLVQGGVQSRGAEEIVNVRLVDTDTDVVVWSRRFVESADAPFVGQDGIVAATVEAIGGDRGAILRAERLERGVHGPVAPIA